MLLDPNRSGQSAMVIAGGDLDARAARLTSAGIKHGDLEPVTVDRVIHLNDPDGNRVVFAGE